MLKGKIRLLSHLILFYAMTNSLPAGIVFKELQEQGCLLHVYLRRDVAHGIQGGWMVFIPQWQKVKSLGRSA